MTFYLIDPDTCALVGSQEDLPALPHTEVTPPPYQQGFYRMFDGSNWQQVPVPSIAPVAGRIVLRRAGLLQAVKDAMAAAGDDAQDWFEYALKWDRGHDVVAAMGQALGLSDTQIDKLFLQAAAIDASHG